MTDGPKRSTAAVIMGLVTAALVVAGPVEVAHEDEPTQAPERDCRHHQCSSAFICGAGAWVIPLALAAACLAAGPVWAWRAKGRTRRGRTRAEEPFAEPGRAWLVAGPGADLKRLGERVARLDARTVVREVGWVEDQVLVAAPDGLEGWLDADRLEPAAAQVPRDEGGER